MKKNQDNLFNALPIVAAAYAEKIGVKINIGGSVAYTDGKSINLPNIPKDAPQTDAIWGYLAHEGAHVRFTDFSVDRVPGIHAELVNIIEDCRIEQLMIKEYPGTAATLLQTAEYMLQAGHYAGVSASDHPASVLSGYMLFWLQAYGVGQPVLEALAEQAEQAFKQVFPMGAFLRMRVLLNRCVASQSTQDAADLATEILKMIEEEEQQQQQQQQNQQQQNQQNDDQGQGDSLDASDSGDSGDKGSGEGEGDQGGNGQGASNSDDQEQSSQQDAGSDKGAGNGDSQGKGTDEAGDCSGQADGQQQGAGGDSSDDSSQDQKQGQGSNNAAGASHGSADQGADEAHKPSLSQLIKAAGSEDLLGDARDALKQELNQYANPHGDTSYRYISEVANVRTSMAGAGLLSSVKGVSAGIRQQLYGLVQASQRKADTQSRSGNRIRASRLARVRAGETKVFNKPAEKVMPNTAVHILVDMSGSMGNARNTKADYEIAREAALAISLALESIPGVNPAVSFFGPGVVQSALRHGERVNAKRFGVNAGGSTPMAEALWYAGFELSKCKEQRKLVICITDGEPDNAGAVLDVLKLYKKSDVETIGIGIGTDLVKRYFQDSIVIDAAADLRKTLFKLMQGSLIAA